MKISTSKLKQIIQEELTSLSEQGLSASDMADAESKAESTAIVKLVIIAGLTKLYGKDGKLDDEEEYGNDIQGVLDDNPVVTKSIADIFREIEQEAGRQGGEGGAPPGSPLDDFDEEMEEALEDYPASPEEAQVSAQEVARDIIMVKVGPEQYTKRGRPSWVERAVEEHGEDFIMTRAVGTAKDFGYE